MVAMTPLPWLAVPVTAASATTVDLSPEQGSDPVGSTVTLTARVYDEDGNLYAGPDTDTRVRFYFVPGSANDPQPPGDSPADDCYTGSDGECTVSFTASADRVSETGTRLSTNCP